MSMLGLGILGGGGRRGKYRPGSFSLDDDDDNDDDDGVDNDGVATVYNNEDDHWSLIRSFSPAADRRIVPLPSSQVVCWQQDDSDYDYHYYDVDDNFDQTCGFYDTAEGRSRPASPTTHLDQVNAVIIIAINIIAIVAIAVTQVMAWFTAKLISCPILQVGGKCPRGNLFQ